MVLFSEVKKRFCLIELGKCVLKLIFRNIPYEIFENAIGNAGDLHFLIYTLHLILGVVKLKSTVRKIR